MTTAQFLSLMIMPLGGLRSADLSTGLQLEANNNF